MRRDSYRFFYIILYYFAFTYQYLNFGLVIIWLGIYLYAKNTINLDFPLHEDILEIIIDPNMSPLENIFDDDIPDNDNVMNHKNTDLTSEVAIAAPNTPVEIHNIESNKEIENHQKIKSIGSASQKYKNKIKSLVYW